MMVFVYASDNGFVDILGISIISLFENNQNERLKVFVLSDGISNENSRILLELAERYRQEIIIIEVNVDDYSSIKLDAMTWSRAAFSRLFIGTILEPFNIDRIIYFDCDIVVNGCIRDLWQYDLGSCCIGMAIDPVSKGHKKNVGVDPSNPYYNSGVLLVDLEKWRANKCEWRLQEYAIEHAGKIPYVDQGLINGTLKNEIKTIPLKYNLITVYCDYEYDEILILRKPTGFFYSKEEFEKAKVNPVIIHYTKSIFTERPWIDGSVHKKKTIWDKYKAISPWKDMESKQKTTWGAERILVTLCRYLPRRITVELQGFFHAVIKPRWDRI